MDESATFESFWDFSVRTYRIEGVPEVCLSLQDDFGADVNMLLYCCWAGGLIGKFDPSLFEQATRFSTHWADNIVKPLRMVRTWMKRSGCSEAGVSTDDCMQLREEIKAAEFSAEKMQEETLESFVGAIDLHKPTGDQTVRDVVKNLEQYSNYAGIAVCDDVRQKYAVIIHAAYPQLSIRRLLREL